MAVTTVTATGVNVWPSPQSTPARVTIKSAAEAKVCAPALPLCSRSRPTKIPVPTASLIRSSVGSEHSADSLDDLDAALDAARATPRLALASE